MENRRHSIFVGWNCPPDIEPKYHRWIDEVYSSAFMNIPGYYGIDRYTSVNKALEYPSHFSIHHGQNRNTFAESKVNPLRVALMKDYDATFYRVEWTWHDLYILVGSFRNDDSPPDTAIVENAPLIHIEGYRVPTSEHEKYDQWFLRWASRVYIPILMQIPGLKACNFFKLSDLSMRWSGRKYIETEIPSYVSMLYFENLESFENFERSPGYAAFRRSMEVELPSIVSTIWNVEYQLRKSFRK